MQVKAIPGPLLNQSSYQPNAPAEAAAKAKVVSMLLGETPTQTPEPQKHTNHPKQLDANNVGIEQLSALKGKSSGQPDNSVQEQDTTEETTSPETEESTEPVKKAEDPALSRQFAQLARQERALRAKAQQQEQGIKAREAALAAREAAILSTQPDLSKYIPRDQIKDQIRGLLGSGELSYDDITQEVLNPVDPRINSTINELKQQIQELRKANEEVKKSTAEQQTNAYQAAVRQIETDVKSLVANDPNFETIKSTRSTKDVVELITKTYDQEGVLLSVEEAAQQVEDYLIDEAMKLTRIGKIKNRLAASSAQNAAKSTQTQQVQRVQQQQPTMKTLTNNTSSSRKLSARERAILAARGELN
jgi:hypothetical protein